MAIIVRFSLLPVVISVPNPERVNDPPSIVKPAIDEAELTSIAVVNVVEAVLKVQPPDIASALLIFATSLPNTTLATPPPSSLTTNSLSDEESGPNSREIADETDGLPSDSWTTVIPPPDAP